MTQEQGNRVDVIEAARTNDAFRREVITGAHEQVIRFARTARDLTELGEMLRRGLHAGLC